jgi:hypothetical protein
MQCEEIREQFADYVKGATGEPIGTSIARHLRECEPCRTELDELKSLWMDLGTIPPFEPPADIRTRFDEMLASHQPLLTPMKLAGPSPRSAGPWRSRLPLLGAAAAVLAGGIVIGYQVRINTTPNTELAELRSELYETRQMVALSLLQQQAATDRLKGINWSYQLGQPSAEVLRALLDTLMHDPNVNVRLATVEALRQFGDQVVVRRGVIEAMLRPQSPMVEISLIDLAVDLKEKDSIGSLRQVAQDQTLDQAVRDRAQKGLMELE